MPNIELHGFGKNGVSNHLLLKIEKVMQEIGLAEDAVVTIFDDVVTSCDSLVVGSSVGREIRSFLRIYCTSDDKASEIINSLAKAGIHEDTEIIRVERFISADEMKSM